MLLAAKINFSFYPSLIKASGGQGVWGDPERTTQPHY